MPPHVDVQGQSEWHHTRSKSTGDINKLEVNSICGCLDSPLFRDEIHEPAKPHSRLDRRQSNPGLSSSENKELGTIETGINASRFVSRIESIIGPESRYYNNKSQTISLQVATQPVLPKAVVPKKTAKSEPTETVVFANPSQLHVLVSEVQVEASDISTATTKYNKSKSHRSFMFRMIHVVSKKSWRLVRYIGEKGKRFMSVMAKAADPTVETSREV